MTKKSPVKLNELTKNLQRPLFSVRIEVLSMHGRSECVEKCNGRLPRPDEFLNEDFKIPGDRNYRNGFIIHISKKEFKIELLKALMALWWSMTVTSSSEPNATRKNVSYIWIICWIRILKLG